MGNSLNNESGSKKGVTLKSFEELGSAGALFAQSVKSPDNEGGKPAEPLTKLPDYSGNEEKTSEDLEEPVIPEVAFDPTNFRVYAKKSFEIIRGYKKSLEGDVKKYLNDDEQKLFIELESKYQELNRQNPGSWDEAKKMIGEIDELRGRYYGLDQRIEAEKEFEMPIEAETVSESYNVPLKIIKPVDANEVVIATEINKIGDNEVKIDDSLSHNTKMSEEKFPAGFSSVKMVEYTPVTETNNENAEKSNITYTFAGQEANFAKSSIEPNSELPKDAVSETLESKISSNQPVPEVAPITIKSEVNSTETGELSIEDQIAIAQKRLDNLLKLRGLDGKEEKKDSTTEASATLASQKLDNNSLSVIKLREAKPGITDEEITIELQRRKENFRELLKERGVLRNVFLDCRKSKETYQKGYKDQLTSRYQEYKSTGWLGKMMGFNPKNLNLYGTTERAKYAYSRKVYSEVLEDVLNEKIVKLDDFEQIFLAQDKIRASLTDRFLLRPARETLQIQSETFPETDRKNILSKFKAAIKANPKLAASVGIAAAAGTLATGGLAAVIPVAFSIGGAMGGGALAGLLSTSFGVNKSERALDSALKNAEIGFSTDDLIAAEMKLVTANQEVELAKNRRDIHTTIGGLVGGGFVGGTLTADYSTGSESILGRIYESLGIDSPTVEVPVAPPETLAPGAPPISEGPRIVIPDPRLETTPPELVTPQPVTPDIPVRPDTPLTPETPSTPPPESGPLPQTPNEVNPAPEGEPELEEDPEEEEIFPETPESHGKYIVQSGDNFWDIMEGQTDAGKISTMEWVKQNQPEHYQELIKLVENYANADSELRSVLGFGGTMDNLQAGSEVNLDLLDLMAREVALNNGWTEQMEFSMPEVPQESEEIIKTKIKTLKI